MKAYTKAILKKLSVAQLKALRKEGDKENRALGRELDKLLVAVRRKEIEITNLDEYLVDIAKVLSDKVPPTKTERKQIETKIAELQTKLER